MITQTHLATGAACDPSVAVAALRAGPDRLLADLRYLGHLFEALVVRDLRLFADAVDGTVQHYRDSDDLEIDAVVTAGDGPWAAFGVKLGQDDIDSATANLLAFARKVDTTKVGEPATLAIITTTGYGYTRPTASSSYLPPPSAPDRRRTQLCQGAATSRSSVVTRCATDGPAGRRGCGRRR